MSKNFELLQRLSNDQEMFDTGAGLSPHPPLHASSIPLQVISPSLHDQSTKEPVELEAPNLEMEERQRNELIKVVQSLFLMAGSKAPRAVVLAGMDPGNGCSWICSRASELLASQVKGPVCIVDANFHSPALHDHFGVSNHQGLSDALDGTEPIRTFVHRLGGDNLWFLGSGGRGQTSGLAAEPMRQRLTELRQYFEFILIDAPALSLGNDAVVLSRAAEGLVLVLKANASRREVARKMVLELRNSGVKILGAVMNQRTFPIPESLYEKL